MHNFKPDYIPSDTPDFHRMNEADFTRRVSLGHYSFKEQKLYYDRQYHLYKKEQLSLKDKKQIEDMLSFLNTQIDLEKCATCNTKDNLCDKCPDFECYPDLGKDTRFCNEHCICPSYPTKSQLEYIIGNGLDY